MLIDRKIEPEIENSLFKGKVIVIYGPRRVGKTTLVRKIQNKFKGQSKYLNCDEPDIKNALTDKTSSELINYFGDNKLIIIDEAQRVKNIGLTLKLIVDNAPHIQVIATGSSSFDLSNKINEPLTGRSIDFFLPPFAISEISKDETETNRLLETRLIYGMYPEIVLNQDKAVGNLKEIYNKYLYKDVFEFQGLKNPEIAEKLLSALALQMGQEVSYTELASLIGVDQKTIANYVRLLELAFVIFKLSPLSRNLRKEIGKSRKIYFWDLGVRNAVINNFNPINLRTDIGQLWENFVIIERAKRNNIKRFTPNRYFWRTWDQQEVDYVEDEGGTLNGFEIKWNTDKIKVPKTFLETYSGSKIELINKNNYQKFIVC